MSGLAGLLAGHRDPGVYRWEAGFSADDLDHTARLAGWALGHLDGVGIESKEAALAALGETLGFPEYFGRNLDALWDCLRDVATPTVVLWDSWGPLAWADLRAFDGILSVLRERAAAGGFAVLLRGEGPEVDVPLLD